MSTGLIIYVYCKYAKKEKKPKVTKQKQRQSTKVIVNIDNSRKTKTNSKNSKPQVIQPPNIYQQLQLFPFNYLQEQNMGNPIGNNLRQSTRKKE